MRDKTFARQWAAASSPHVGTPLVRLLHYVPLRAVRCTKRARRNSLGGRMKANKGAWASRVLALAVIGAVGTATAQVFDEPIKPLPEKLDLDGRKVALGRILFHDKRLSKDNSLACASCHDLGKGGVDGRQTAIGIGGQVGPINTPTVLNSSLNFRQFWNGRAATLEEQAAGPVHNPGEMGSNWKEVLGKLGQDKKMISQFDSLYGDGLQPANIQDAIATFERSLITPSRFDRYLRGESGAINEEERRGYQLFKNYGCIACHQGMNIGGNMFQTFGVLGSYFQ